jgi:acyl-CoA synthetase
VQRAAAVPVKDARLGEKVCLAVVFRDGNAIAPDQLLAHLDAVGLSKYDMPEYFLRLDEIPLTPNGKMLKRAIVDWIKEGKVTPEPIRFETKRASA